MSPWLKGCAAAASTLPVGLQRLEQLPPVAENACNVFSPDMTFSLESSTVVAVTLAREGTAVVGTLQAPARAGCENRVHPSSLQMLDLRFDSAHASANGEYDESLWDWLAAALAYGPGRETPPAEMLGQPGTAGNQKGTVGGGGENDIWVATSHKAHDLCCDSNLPPPAGGVETVRRDPPLFNLWVTGSSAWGGH